MLCFSNSHCRRLLERPRERISANPHAQHRWGYDADVRTVGTTNIYGDRTIFPFHELLHLMDADAPEMVELLQRQRANCAAMHRLAKMDLPLRGEMRCEVCQITLTATPEVKMHLYSRLHVDREKFVGYVDE